MNHGGDLGYARVGEEVTTQEAGSDVRRHKSITGRAQHTRCVEEATQRQGVRMVGVGVEVGSRCDRVTVSILGAEEQYTAEGRGGGKGKPLYLESALHSGGAVYHQLHGVAYSVDQSLHLS